VRGKFTNRVHKHGGFLFIALYRDTVPLTIPVDFLTIIYYCCNRVKDSIHA